MTRISGTTAVDDGVVGVDIEEGSGGGNPRCHWFESVCTATPTHYIVSADDESTATFCGRHYAVSLAKATLRIPGDPGTFADRIARYGAID